jgi:hypothetical protein
MTSGYGVVNSPRKLILGASRGLANAETEGSQRPEEGHSPQAPTESHGARGFSVLRHGLGLGSSDACSKRISLAGCSRRRAWQGQHAVQSTSAAKPIVCASLRCADSFYNLVTVVDPPPRPRRPSTAGILKIEDGRLVADLPSPHSSVSTFTELTSFASPHPAYTKIPFPVSPRHTNTQPPTMAAPANKTIGDLSGKWVMVSSARPPLKTRDM